MNNSLYIILNQYKKEHITEEEAVTLIEDIYRNRQPIITPYYPEITYTERFPEYKVTCNVSK